MLREAIIGSLIVSNLMVNAIEEQKIEIPFLTDQAQIEENAEPAGEKEEWAPREGDTFQINVAKNIGYLVHLNGQKFEFEVLTGQQHRVCYMRMCYFAGTPIREWEVKSMDIKGDRVTFGETGKFLRLYKDNQEEEARFTHYGIHGHKYYQSMLNSDNHYRSYGCILVSEEILNIIEQAYKINGDYLKVKTVWEL